MHKKRYLVRDTVSNHVVQILLNDAFNLASNFDILTSCLASYSDYNVDLYSAKWSQRLCYTVRKGKRED